MEAINLIRNCKVQFRKVCPKTWAQLAPTPAEGVKFCRTCDREVFLCETDVDAVEHARAGHCLAKPRPDLSGLPGLILGQPRVPMRQPTSEERLLREEAFREDAKTRALQDVEYASRTCPGCGYPCADWLRDCRVCGWRLGRADRGSGPRRPTRS
jgi:hypothetical protein